MLNLYLGDFRHLMKNLPKNSIDLVLTDPPYAASYRPLYTDLGREARRALKPGGFLVSYMNQNGLPEILGRLEEHLDYYWLGMSLYSGMSPPGYWRKHAKIVSCEPSAEFGDLDPGSSSPALRRWLGRRGAPSPRTDGAARGSPGKDPQAAPVTRCEARRRLPAEVCLLRAMSPRWS
jgi:hypothetical protein